MVIPAEMWLDSLKAVLLFTCFLITREKSAEDIAELTPCLCVVFGIIIVKGASPQETILQYHNIKHEVSFFRRLT